MCSSALRTINLLQYRAAINAVSSVSYTPLPTRTAYNPGFGHRNLPRPSKILRVCQTSLSDLVLLEWMPPECSEELLGHLRVFNWNNRYSIDPFCLLSRGDRAVNTIMGVACPTPVHQPFITGTKSNLKIPLVPVLVSYSASSRQNEGLPAEVR